MSLVNKLCKSSTSHINLYCKNYLSHYNNIILLDAWLKNCISIISEEAHFDQFPNFFFTCIPSSSTMVMFARPCCTETLEKHDISSTVKYSVASRMVLSRIWITTGSEVEPSGRKVTRVDSGLKSSPPV